MKTKLRIIAAANEALKFLRKNPRAIDEELFQNVLVYIDEQDIDDEHVKFAILASVSELYKIFLRNQNLPDKEILKETILKIPLILENLKS